jgi:hypothetical protein
MKNKKGNVAVIALIVVIVIITAGVVGWMFAKKQQISTPQAMMSQPGTPVAQTQPTTLSADKAVGLQTYQNDEYGFKFQYPQDWTIDTADNSVNGCNGGKDVCNFVKPQKQKNCTDSRNGSLTCLDGIKFGIINNPKKLWINYFLENVYGWTQDSGIITGYGDYEHGYEIKKVELGNGYVYKFTETSGTDGSEVSHYWITLGSEHFFVIKGVHLIEDEKTVLEKVVSSFAFLDNSNGNKANWETYKNTNCIDSGKGFDYYHRGKTIGIYDNASTISGFGLEMGIIKDTTKDNVAQPETGMIRSIYWDTCTGKTQLNEGYCKDGKIWAAGTDCPNGCKDGACKK